MKLENDLINNSMWMSYSILMERVRKKLECDLRIVTLVKIGTQKNVTNFNLLHERFSSS